MQSEIIEPEIQAAFDGAAVADPPTSACPDAEQLWGALEGTLDLEARLAVLEHCARCPSCAEELRVTKAFIEATHAESYDQQSEPCREYPLDSKPVPLYPDMHGLPVRDAPRASASSEDEGLSTIIRALRFTRDPGSKPNSSRSYLGLGGIASVAAAVSFWLWQPSPPQAPPNNLRGGQVSAPMPADPAFRFIKHRFEWPAMGHGPQSYRLELISAKDFRLIHRIEGLQDNHYQPDSEILALLQAQKRFYWRVVSEVDASPRGTSTSQLVELSAPGSHGSER